MAGYIRKPNRAPDPRSETRLRRSATPLHHRRRFLVSDPPLEARSSPGNRRGRPGAAPRELKRGERLSWENLAASARTNSDDILAIPSPDLQGFRLLPRMSAGTSPARPRGPRSISRSSAMQLLCQLCPGSNAAGFLDAPGRIRVEQSLSPDPDTGIIQGAARAIRSRPSPVTASRPGIDYAVTDKLKVRVVDGVVCGQPVTSSATTNNPGGRSCRPTRSFNVHASYQIDQGPFQIYGPRRQSVSTTRYGDLWDLLRHRRHPQILSNGSQFHGWPRSVQPRARPRALYVGLKADVLEHDPEKLCSGFPKRSCSIKNLEARRRFNQIPIAR